MKKEGNILVVDDNRSILAALKMLLSSYFDKVITLASPNQIKSKIKEEKIDIVLLDMNFSAGINNGNEGLFWLSEIRKENPEVIVILITAYAEIELAIKAMKEGATDFIVKPWDNARLIQTLQVALQKNISPQKEKEAECTIPSGKQMYWGNSEAMNHLRIITEKIATTDANVLITGENGTGKEMLAQHIFKSSARKDQQFIGVDMGSITETLFETELFGHVKGAFTDARNSHTGKFELAHNGTLFLDEIGNLPYHLQSKLLTALQRRSIFRVGSNTPVEIDIRLICATNQQLEKMVAQGSFREDLLYRINTIHLEIPPLRTRKEDIIPLAELFAKQYCRKYQKKDVLFSEEAKDVLLKHTWPGNIRELQHCMEKAVIICENGTLQKDDIQIKAPLQAGVSAQTNVTLNEMEYEMIMQAMKQHRGNMSAIASQLGISRQTLYNKMKKYDL